MCSFLYSFTSAVPFLGIMIYVVFSSQVHQECSQEHAKYGHANLGSEKVRGWDAGHNGLPGTRTRPRTRRGQLALPRVSTSQVLEERFNCELGALVEETEFVWPSQPSLPSRVG